MPRRPRTALAALLAAVTVATLATGCARGRTPTPTPSPESTALDDLGAAIQGVNATRRSLLEGPDLIVAAVRALDAGDAEAAVGDRPGTFATRPATEAAVGRAAPAFTRLPRDLAGYAAALAALDRASTAPELDNAQRAAVREVARAGRVEHAATTRFLQAARRAWPRYTNLDAALTTWVRRARAGWYRNSKEAADAYAVLVTDGRPALDTARDELQTADAARARATAATSAAIERARRALATLVG